MASPKTYPPHINDGIQHAGWSIQTTARAFGVGLTPFVEVAIQDAGDQADVLLTPDEAVLLAGWLLQRVQECRR